MMPIRSAPNDDPKALVDPGAFYKVLQAAL
jgi:hypothetical protein